MFSCRRRVVSSVFWVFAVVFVALALAGAVRAYSPVPYWDMWDGYLGFYVKASSGDWSAWWAQHNEHRIVLARLLFWIDLAFFQGAGWFLVLVNCLLLALVCAIFLLAWREQSEGVGRFVGAFLVAWLFSWSQEENLTWGFQSQFILAQLLPLVAFYLLHKSAAQETRSLLFFSSAAFFGVLAIGSMANGVLALPLLTLYAVLIRSGWRRSGFLALLSLACLWLYFTGYAAVASHGSLGQALRGNPGRLIQYVLLYLGGPFYYLARGGPAGLLLAQLAGSVLIVGSAASACLAINDSKRPTLQFAMLIFILYVAGSALGTAGGRSFLGLEQAVSSRYMTPALMAWAALLVLVAPSLLSRGRWVLGALLLTVLGLMLPQQLLALKSKQDVLYERRVAALALELGVDDQSQINSVFPSSKWALDIVKVPVERNLSVFGLPPIMDLRERIGNRYEPEKIPTTECLGHLDETHRVPDDPRFLNVRGWMLDSANHDSPVVLSIADDTGEAVGFALSGQLRPDVATAIGKKAGRSGFEGYLLAKTMGRPVSVTGKNFQCRMTSSVPVSIAKVSDLDIGAGK